jgi:aminoglycoside phosphotransferase (APT) family kinase protein
VSDFVTTRVDAAELEREPLVVLDPLRDFLDAARLGEGPVIARLIGDGHSNVTCLVVRGEQRWVLRRPPRGPLPPSAHDVLREARLLSALAQVRARVPTVVAVCADTEVIGAPFYLMEFVHGDALTTTLPLKLATAGSPMQIADELVKSLVEIHRIDVERGDFSGFGRGGGYLERQLRRFRALLDDNATRPLPELQRVGDWLEARRPVSAEVTIVHGDYRLGNVIFASHGGSPRVAAILDWEMATLGDPLADLGYMTAMWAQQHEPPDPMLALSEVTRGDGFPSRDWLIDRYARLSGREPANLHWYQTLAVWKSAIFLESSYKRYRAGATDDHYFARLEDGVPELARRAQDSILQQSTSGPPLGQ